MPIPLIEVVCSVTEHVENSTREVLKVSNHSKHPDLVYLDLGHGACVFKREAVIAALEATREAFDYED